MTYMKALIINADDLGMTPGVTRGILKAHRKGSVTSTSALMNSSFIKESLPQARRTCPTLGIGVHLVITEGKPLLLPEQVPTLVDESGAFYELHQHLERLPALNSEEVYREWWEQIESFIAFGQPPDHLDSHHHISYFNHTLFEIMLRLAHEYHLPIRLPPNEYLYSLGGENVHKILLGHNVHAPAACITSLYDRTVSMDNMLRIIETLPDGVHELMCHPGYADQILIDTCSYSTPRELELSILTSPQVRAALETNQVKLVNFASLTA